MNTLFQAYEYIPSGQFRVGKNSDTVYRMILGSCLGVAMYDTSQKIGGIIHLILPEPLSETHGGFPEKYASTGIPLLLKELENIGASTSQLQATVAGGGFVGPVNQQDLRLDIGGRSEEIIMDILEKAGVRVINSETGGFFNCTLELNMGTGKTRILPFLEEELITAPIVKPSINDILKTIDDLKPIPQTALKILRMFHDSRCGIDAIAKELGRDQVLSAQTLKMCNSILFSSFPVESLKDAVLLMGQGMLVQAVITAAIRSYFDQTTTLGYSLCKGGLYFHALAVALVSEKLAAATGKVQPEIAYTAGLLHDIGKTVLDQYVAGCAPLFFRGLNSYHTNIMELEQKVLGITHYEAGLLLAKKWHFPQSLCQVITHHHAPEQAESHEVLVCIVYLANLLTGRFQAGVSIDAMPADSLAYALQHIGITMENLPEIIDQVPFDLLTNYHQDIHSRYDSHAGSR